MGAERASSITATDALPEGWVSAQCGQVLEFRYGKGLVEANRRPGRIPVYGSNGVVGSHDEALTTAQTIVIGRKGSVGEVHLSPVPCWPIDTTYFITDFGPFVPLFLFRLLRSHRLGDLDQSTAVPGLSREQAYTADLVIPPLAEQNRIVAKVEALLARVNAARQRLAKVPAILKRFRQAVLAAACSGQLTAEWREKRPDVEAAGRLLERLAEERRVRWQARNANRKYRLPDDVEREELTEVPQTWAWTNFDHCAWEITVGHVGPMKDRYVPNGMPFLRSQNVRPLRFDSTGLVFIKSEFHAALRKSALYGGEILVTRSGANTGDCCVFPKTVGEANCADLVVTRPLSGLLPAYGAIYISSPDGQTRIGLRETGMAQPHFNIGAMRVKPFPLPPLVEQHEIVRRVEALFQLADAIEKRVAAATARADKLTQAILAKAFRGELVPTEAELSRQEGRDYEPASVLLERIRAEFSNKGAGQRVSRKKRSSAFGRHDQTP